MGNTKKVGICGKFGVRYGLSIRKKILKVEEKKTDICPNCGKAQLRRPASGIWICKKCGIKFAGGAYLPETPEETKVEK